MPLYIRESDRLWKNFLLYRFKHHENGRIINVKQIPNIYSTIKSILHSKIEAFYLHHTSHIFQKFKQYVKHKLNIPDNYKMQFKLKNYQLPSFEKLLDFWKQEINIDVKYLHFSVVLRRYINAFLNDVEIHLFQEYLYPIYFKDEQCQQSKWTVNDECPYKFDFSNVHQPVRIAHKQHQKFGGVQFLRLHAFDYVWKHIRFSIRYYVYLCSPYVYDWKSG